MGKTLFQIPPRLVSAFDADVSLSLINRTGAHFICRDLVDAIPDAFASRRYWRVRMGRDPEGLLRQILGKLMLFEFGHPGLQSWLPDRACRTRPRRPTLFFDPLYVLGVRLGPHDVVLCLDVGPLSMPELFDPATTRLYARAYSIIRRVKPNLVFISQTSRSAFIALFGSDFPRLDVIPLYVRPGSEEAEEERPEGVDEPFLLTVGALEARKNHLRSIEAFNRSGLRQKGFSHVICGAKGHGAAEVVEAARRVPGIHIRGYVRDAELRWLYRHASGFVLPSLLEGFGMPALEAARHGLLPVISQDGALAEAAGDGAICVDARDPDSIAAGLRWIADLSGAERAARVDRIRRHAATLTYERFVQRWTTLLEVCA